MHNTIKVRVRLDFRGTVKPGRFLFGGKSTEKIAEELREQQAAFLRNVPLQGIFVEDIDMGMSIYMVSDEIEGRDVAYAPIILLLQADSLEDVAQFISREEFRKIEILEPEEMMMSKFDVERLLFRMNRELQKHRQYLERRYSHR